MLLLPFDELAVGREIALRCPRPRNSGGTDSVGRANLAESYATARGADGAAHRPHPHLHTSKRTNDAL